MWFSALSILGRPSFGHTAVRCKPVPTRLTLEVMEDRSVPSFLAPVTSSGGGGSLAVGDFNQDGRADIAFLSPNNTVTVSLSNGDGTFRQSSILGSAKGGLYSAFVSDQNGDGNLDVVGQGWSGKGRNYSCGRYGCYYSGDVISNVWLGKGDGTFVARPLGSKDTIRSPSWPPLISTAASTYGDFNHDGSLDSATLDKNSDKIVVRLWDNTPTGPTMQTYTGVSNPDSIASGDFNGDGWTDLIEVSSLSSGNPSLSVMFNDGVW